MAGKRWTDEMVDCLINCLENEKCWHVVTCRDYADRHVHQWAVERIVSLKDVGADF